MNINFKFRFQGGVHVHPVHPPLNPRLLADLGYCVTKSEYTLIA